MRLQGAGGYWHWDVPWTAREGQASYQAHGPFSGEPAFGRGCDQRSAISPVPRRVMWWRWLVGQTDTVFSSRFWPFAVAVGLSRCTPLRYIKGMARRQHKAGMVLCSTPGLYHGTNVDQYTGLLSEQRIRRGRRAKDWGWGTKNSAVATHRGA
jgi:hypothetical protein